jgi:16S rRNA (cytosine967-C5)-methyltransferase
VNASLRALCRAKAEGQGLPSSNLQAGEADFPDWLTRIWTEELGREKAAEVMGAMLAAPETVLRTNTLKTDRTRLIDRLSEEGYEAEPVDALPQAVRVLEGGDIRKTECYRQGWCVQQDSASQLIVEVLDPRPGEAVLDLCAAPGIKTTHIAEKMDNQGRVLALDSNPARLRELIKGCRRLGVTVGKPVCADASIPGLPLGDGVVFDRILVDAPCSGLGILRRNPEKKWRPAPDFATLSNLQEDLMRTAAPLVRSGGILVYSTCTIHREENETIVERFLAEHRDYELEDVSPFLPDGLEDFSSESGYFFSWARPTRFDLFFAARLRRVC